MTRERQALYDVRVDLPMRLYRDEEARVWVAACDVLGVISQGETEAQAVEALSEAVEMFARQCDARGLKPTFAPADRSHHVTIPDILTRVKELEGVIARARAEVRAFQEQAAATAP